MNSFAISRLPVLHFGAGKISLLMELAKLYGKRVTMVTGGGTIERSPVLQQIIDDAKNKGFQLSFQKITCEPSPILVNTAVHELRPVNADVIIAIGGGSVLDAGKAISAMLRADGNVRDYLEGVGTRKHSGEKIPFIAVPTTAGTGSESTKNAVLSEVGDTGFKRSLRHDNFVPDAVLIDPELMIPCPPDITARCGMDAFTQLLESYVSTNANPVTDALALKGLSLVARSLRNAWLDGNDLHARADMAMAAYFSGITLANAGLGTVHGIAGAFGGFYQISHGHICSALMSPINRRTVESIRNLKRESIALQKYARVGRLFSDIQVSETGAIDGLLDTIDALVNEFGISKINHPNLDVVKIADASDNKSNPVKLTQSEIRESLEEICA